MYIINVYSQNTPSLSDKKNSRAKKNLGIYKGLVPESKHNHVSEIISNARQPGRSLFETETPVYMKPCVAERQSRQVKLTQ